MDRTPTISGSPSSRRGDHATHGKIGHRLPPNRSRDSCVSGDEIVRNTSARISGDTKSSIATKRRRNHRAREARDALPGRHRSRGRRLRPRTTTTTSRRRRRPTTLVMQWTGALADETSPELVGSWANTRDSDIVSRRRRPIRSVHAAVAHCWAEGNSEMCLPVRRQYRDGAVRRSRVGLGGRSADVRRRLYARRGAVRVLRGRTRRSRVA
jgi:hypothetical protein